MNIGLIDPSAKKTASPMPHLGLAYVAGALETKGHSVAVLDLDVSNAGEIEQFLGTPFDLIGITAASFTFRRAVEAIKAYKARNPGVPVVMGGPHISLELEKVFDGAGIDFGVYGEGEFTITELAARLEAGFDSARDGYDGILGLIYKRDGKIIVNPPRLKNRELDRLPFPSYASLAMERYDTYPVITSRGCPYKCTFCTVPLVDGNLWRERSAENVLEEIRSLTSRYGKKTVAFCDDNFNGQVERVKELCARLIDSKLLLKWFCWSFRADRADPDMLKAMKEAGCYHVSVGLESADPQVLKDVKKSLTLKKVEDGVRNIKAAGISCQTLNMIGNAGDNLETVKATISFNRRLSVDGALFHLAVPYPKTELWDWVEKNGRWLKFDYTEFHHFSAEPIFETDDFVGEERLKAYRLARRFEREVAFRAALRKKWARFWASGVKDLTFTDILKSLRTLTRLALQFIFAEDRKLTWKDVGQARTRRLFPRGSAAQTSDLDASGVVSN